MGNQNFNVLGMGNQSFQNHPKPTFIRNQTWYINTHVEHTGAVMCPAPILRLHAQYSALAKPSFVKRSIPLPPIRMSKGVASRPALSVWFLQSKTQQLLVQSWWIFETHLQKESNMLSASNIFTPSMILRRFLESLLV